MSTLTSIPSWDLSVYFPSVESAEYLAESSRVEKMVGGLETLFAEAGISPVGEVPVDSALLLKVVRAYDGCLESVRFLATYAQLTVATDSGDDAGQAAVSALNPVMVRMQKLGSSFTAWVGGLDLESLVSGVAELADYAFPLEKAKVDAGHLMSADEEGLAADLAQPSSTAWTKLYGDFSSNIEVEVNGEKVPMSACRAMAYDGDEAVRRAAYFAELEAWKANEIPIAAAMNSIKGAANTLSRRRGWAAQLDATLFRCNMDRESLDAMMSAAEEAFPMFRRYMQAKAKLLGRSAGLPFYDLFAPVGEDKEWDWEQGKAFVEEGFRSYSDKMGDFAARSFEENWHDVAPKKGKRDGAFCSSTRGDESRMLHNFKPAFGSVSTLAHELGHAYHNVCLAERTQLQRQTPMTLAETASIFCETIIKRRALAATNGQAKLAILEAAICGANQVVVDITSRFRFESETIERRFERELSPTELCDVMKRAQVSTYGDGLDAELLHPYMWAAKPHYYAYMAFYNFPYMFGLLFALGLYRVYEAEPNGFHTRYDELLSSTGLSMAADLTQRFGINIRDKAFWAGSLAVIGEDIEEYVTLAGG